ncbi:RsmB/NOP family class I SAM-dependent RNA methyltransferase [Amaricoccus sp.]|uniref:RsmB/NOP family class I SAM-dependent RNA methyltransferase n=1 Tax=Amaricoccus sp. TaxID=1872485 RepID=UPI002639A495|nr:RsmB/NOP family class I SAM-dependent RNA methyltransferase [Amaricoccus sp.]HRO11972.1 RsmB/NOP family class I SAM-dependent RNA methyltransferase [Amaricoccus sp.]
MTPGARLSAAIEILDAALAGAPAERELTRWARASRYAGSKDRAAVRDLVYDGLRRRRSFGFLGGGDTGRAILLAREAAEGAPLDALFTGEGFDPAPPTPAERTALAGDLAAQPAPVRLDFPDFLEPELRASLGADFAPVLAAMQRRAPVDLRVNTLKTNRDAATVVLARDGVQVAPHPLVRDGLRVLENPRLVAASRAYTQGMVELQDASSQLVVETAGVRPGMTVLDYCAGGGGKTLALAAALRRQGQLMAWDANPRRMADLPERARRAGAEVRILSDAECAALGPVCDLVLADAPCSGSGAWRRKPEGKWRLTPQDLDRLTLLQDSILDAAAARVTPGGTLVYATCSLLSRENEARAAAFVARHPAWRPLATRRLSPLDDGDGFFIARFRAPTHATSG